MWKGYLDEKSPFLAGSIASCKGKVNGDSVKRISFCPGGNPLMAMEEIMGFVAKRGVGQMEQKPALTIVGEARIMRVYFEG